MDGGEVDASRHWHTCMGHAGDKSLKMLSNQGLLKGMQTWKLEFNEPCVKDNRTRVKIGIAIYNTKGILDYVSSDVTLFGRLPP